MAKKELKMAVKELLILQGKKHKDLCDAIGITDGGMRKIYCRNSCELSTLEKIASFFECPVTYFLEEEKNVTHGDNSPIGNHNIIGNDAVLVERIKSLERELKEKDARIQDLKETLEFLKSASQSAPKS